jgi:toxin ParE1/3/4
MKVVWLRKASLALDLEYEYLAARNPKAARLVFRRIIATARRLSAFPNSGRPGQIDGTRELVVPGFPYVIVYRVSADAVEILRVFHTSRNWPELMQ